MVYKSTNKSIDYINNQVEVHVMQVLTNQEFEVKYKAIHKKLRNHIKKTVCDYDDCNDVCQNVAEQLLKKMYSGKLTPSNFNQYAFSQANYAICNHFTAKKKDSFVDSMDEKEIDIIDKRIDNDVIEYYDMISTLEPRLRECVNLFVMGYTRHEIADNLHIGIQTVYNYLNQSRDLLQKLNKIGKK